MAKSRHRGEIPPLETNDAVKPPLRSAAPRSSTDADWLGATRAAAYLATAAVFAVGFGWAFVWSTDISTERPLDPAEGSVPHRSAGAATDERSIKYIGVVPRHDPVTLYAGYRPIIDYLNRATPYRFELKLSPSYEAAVEQLVDGTVEAAFLGAYVYARARRRNAALHAILLARNEQGEPRVRSVLFTRADSPLISEWPPRLDERDPDRPRPRLRVALPSPASFSAVWGEAEIRRIVGDDPEGRVDIRSFRHHLTVVSEVLRGRYDVGVVRDRVASVYTGQIRTLAQSDAIPASPLVVAGPADSPVARAVSEALLAFDPRTPHFSAMASTWDEEFRHGFAAATDADFAGLAALLDETAQPGGLGR